MKDSYKKSVTLNCITCGDTDFEYNDDKTWIKCNRCEREYTGGYNELVELNQEHINSEVKNLTEEVTKDIQEDFNKMLKSAFKNSKHIKFKK